ncbi:MAG: hypothetical protein IJW13_00380 [Clostridia bacterium]|nr:hypothetical protein [Clostridia bacterium]
MEYTVLKGYCSKNNKKFLLECKKEGSKLTVVNFLPVTESEYNGVKAASASGDIYTESELLACTTCGNRKVAGCNCFEKKGKCAAEYNFQCIYCSKFKMQSSSKMPEIYVSKPRYDNIGALLDKMSIKHKPYDGTCKGDILFINCGTADSFNATQLKNFVSAGGCLYVSDLAHANITNPFGSVANFNRIGEVCTVQARVCDSELASIIGSKTEITFDLPAWAIIENLNQQLYPNTKILLQGSTGKYAGIPLMFSFDCGSGKVFYTSFHNYAQASEKEKMLLQLLLLKQIGSNTNQTIEQVSSLVGLNIAHVKDLFKK